MEDDHGRARVYNQAGDSIELVDEAIDTCPVNCIHWVSYEDLVILENERRGQFINNAARLRSQAESTSFSPPTAASCFDSGSMRCNNCPGRGCKDCPMFGVGLNPVYLERLEEREERRRVSGEAQAEEEDQRHGAPSVDGLLDALYAAPLGAGMDLDDALYGAPPAGMEDPPEEAEALEAAESEDAD